MTKIKELAETIGKLKVELNEFKNQSVKKEKTSIDIVSESLTKAIEKKATTILRDRIYELDNKLSSILNEFFYHLGLKSYRDTNLTEYANLKEMLLDDNRLKMSSNILKALISKMSFDLAHDLLNKNKEETPKPIIE